MRNIPGTYNCIKIWKSEPRNLAADDGKSIAVQQLSHVRKLWTGTKSVTEHGSVDEAELNSPSAMISSSETS